MSKKLYTDKGTPTSSVYIIVGQIDGRYLVDKYTRWGAYLTSMDIGVTFFHHATEEADNKDADYSWYFGDSGYSFDRSAGKEEASSTGWPCGGSAHTFPDTGMKKSWCKWCGEEGEFQVTTGKYEAKVKSV